MSKREGPSVTVKLSCLNCAHETTESYQCQGDSGCDVYCTHGGGKRRVGDTRWETPSWCPLMPPSEKEAEHARCVAALEGMSTYRDAKDRAVVDVDEAIETLKGLGGP